MAALQKSLLKTKLWLDLCGSQAKPRASVFFDTLLLLMKKKKFQQGQETKSHLNFYSENIKWKHIEKVYFCNLFCVCVRFLHDIRLISRYIEKNQHQSTQQLVPISCHPREYCY